MSRRWYWRGDSGKSDWGPGWWFSSSVPLAFGSGLRDPGGACVAGMELLIATGATASGALGLFSGLSKASIQWKTFG